MRVDRDRLELLARVLHHKGIGHGRGPVIPRRQGWGDAPLAYGQRRLWFLDQYDPGSPLYNDCFAVRIEGGELDERALEAALGRILERHEILRTWFVTSPSGHPVQKVRAAVATPLVVEDLRELQPAERARRLEERILQDARRPLYLDQAPLLRALLLRLADDAYELAITVHHIVSDGTSLGILFDELGRFYERAARGEGLEEPELPVQYGDYAQWERDTITESRIQERLAYWRVKLGALPHLELPVDRPREGLSRGRGALLFFRLPDVLVEDLRRFCRREGLTVCWTLLAAYFALLHRITGQEDFAVGTPSSCRDRVDLEGLVGFFVRTLLVRGDLSGNPGFRELVERVRATVLEAKRHEDVPYDRVVQVVRRGAPAGDPLIQAWFSHMHDMIKPPRIAGLATSHRVVDAKNARFELCLIVDESEEGIGAYFEYDADLFEASRVEGWAGDLVGLLRAGLDRPDTRLELLREAGNADGGRRSARLALSSLQARRARADRKDAS